MKLPLTPWHTKTYWQVICLVIALGVLSAIAGWYFSYRQSHDNSPSVHFTSGVLSPLSGIFMPPSQDQLDLQATSAPKKPSSPNGQAESLLAPTPTPRLGIYESAGPQDPQSLARLEEIRRAGFNTVINYDILDGSKDQINQYLRKAASLGLKVIVSIKDFYDLDQNSSIHLSDFAEYGSTNDQIVQGVIRAFKDNPGVYGWYIADEQPENPADAAKWLPVLQARYQLIKAIDPTHPTLMILSCYEGSNIISWPPALASLETATDDIGFDSYPVPYTPLTVINQCATTLSQSVPQAANRWFVIQAFSWASYPDVVTQDHEDLAQARYPTASELSAMISSARQSGINNILVYSYFDLKNDPVHFESAWSTLTQTLERSVP